jgi:stage II sporulation protein D
MWHLLAESPIIINGAEYKTPATLYITPKKIIVHAHTQPSLFDLTWQRYDVKAYTRPKPQVRVLVHELPNVKAPPVIIGSSNGFILFDPEKTDQKRESKEKILSIAHTDTHITINGKRMEQTHIRIVPKEGYISINEHQFHGSLSIVKNSDHLLVINHVDLEEYVYSVLKTESWPGWPIEVNKAFAIASRSYVLCHMKQADTLGQLYHVKNTNAHQTYQGIHTNSVLRTAVEQTRGMCLTYNNEPALAMFDSCCGGVIPAHIDDFNFEKAPYLARTYPCKHCKRCKIYAWKKELSLADFSKRLAAKINKKIFVKDVKIAKKDKAGLVRELQIKHGKESKLFSGKELYAALKQDIKSFCYSVQRKKDKLIFSGRGYGHHIGICQWGAREMVRDGWPYIRILDFYYPGTTIMKLT